jgi:hypothetical protein
MAGGMGVPLFVVGSRLGRKARHLDLVLGCELAPGVESPRCGDLAPGVEPPRYGDLAPGVEPPRCVVRFRIPDQVLSKFRSKFPLSALDCIRLPGRMGVHLQRRKLT